MAAFRWLSELRTPVRARFLDLFSKTVATNEGRRIIADNLRGLTVPGRLPPSADLPPAEHYAAPVPRKTHDRPAPVFVTGRFRSGSTLVWNLFRQVPSCRSFYEPLNERRWFDSTTRGTRIDRTHVGVEDYWSEYEGLSHLAQYFHDDWGYRHLYLERHAWEPDLASYIQGLIDSAPGRAVLQFNRVDFRLPWLRHQFPDARLIHLYRNPRDQWCSSLVKPEQFPKEGSIEVFRAHDYFYLLAWAEDLSHHFPFLDPRRARHPYEVFYYLWRLSYDFGHAYAHASFGLEAMCASPHNEIERLMNAACIGSFDLDALTRIVAPISPGKWRTYADSAWFDAHEQRCEEVLQRLARDP